MREYILEVLAGFDRDPADTDYQQGYRDAHEEMLRVLDGGVPQVVKPKPKLTLVKG